MGSEMCIRDSEMIEECEDRRDQGTGGDRMNVYRSARNVSCRDDMQAQRGSAEPEQDREGEKRARDARHGRVPSGLASDRS